MKKWQFPPVKKAIVYVEWLDLHPSIDNVAYSINDGDSTIVKLPISCPPGVYKPEKNQLMFNAVCSVLSKILPEFCLYDVELKTRSKSLKNYYCGKIKPGKKYFPYGPKEFIDLGKRFKSFKVEPVPEINRRIKALRQCILTSQ